MSTSPTRRQKKHHTDTHPMLAVGQRVDLEWGAREGTVVAVSGDVVLVNVGEAEPVEVRRMLVTPL